MNRVLIGSLVVCTITLLWFAKRSRSPRIVPPCASHYSHLFSGDETEIRVLFGYKDSRPSRFVGDRYERNIFVADLLRPCEAMQYACGFTRDRDDGDLFHTTIPGPTTAAHKIRLFVHDSSAGPDDDENRRDPYQTRLTSDSERFFLDGLKSAAIVFYNGHSRDGGGPDFGPPRLGEHAHVHYGWYAKTKPGFHSMMSALQSSQSKVRLVGFFSCAATKHFADDLRKARPETAFVTSSELLYYADALTQMKGALSALLGMQCKTQFDSAVGAESTGGKTSVFGLFD